MDEGMTAIADELATPAIETQEQPAAPTETEGPVDLDAEVSTEAEVEGEPEGDLGYLFPGSSFLGSRPM